MRKIYILAILLFVSALFCSGCGLVSVLGTPSGSEELVEAKFDISQRYDDKILVLVNQPAWMNSPVNYRRELTNKMNSYMRLYFKDMPAENIIEYETVKQTRSMDIDFDNRNVIELGEMFDAGLIMYVEVLEFDMLRLTAEEYYTAEIKTVAMLYDGNTGDLLWPEIKGDSVTSLEIEFEKGVEATMAKLATANAHCILRNLYDCKKHQYKVIEEKRQYEIEDW
jgi:hypothetical protein